jgi:fatty acid CoA ligase FadD9
MAEQRAAQSGPPLAVRRMARLLSVDPEIRAARVSSAELEALRDSGDSAIDLLAAACKTFASRPCLGTRLGGPTAGALTAISYGDLWSRVTATASEFLKEGIADAGMLVAIHGSGSVDWIVADLACLYVGAVSVPLPRTLARDDLLHIVRETEIACIVAAPECLENAEFAAASCPSVRSVVSMGELESDRRPTRAGMSLREIERCGRLHPAAPRRPTGADDLFSIVYTSGSTGRPKGVMLTARRWAETLRDAVSNKPIPTITVGYLPLSHMAGRISVYTTLMTGGRTNLVSEDDIPALFETIRLTRPTSMTLVPRVSGLLHQQFLQLAFEAGADVSGGYDEPSLAGIIKQIRDERLGGRLCFATTGAAPTAPEVVEFLREGLGVHLVDAYGSTEVARVAVNGIVLPGIEYKLIDVPEAGYMAKDLPYPRGELAVRSSRQTPGYFRNAAANAALFDESGFVRTGDIVEERGPRRIVLIDRKNDVIRLAHGEYVNLGRLESLFAAHSRYIEQAFVFGESSRDFVLAVIVPSALVESHADVAETPGPARNRAVKQLLLGELHRIAAGNGLRSSEVPRDILVSTEPFTRANGLLSDAGKYRRPAIRERFGAGLQQLYAEIAERQVHARLQSQRSKDAPLETRLRVLVAAILGREELTSDALQSSFVSLGGDSLSAMRLCDALSAVAGFHAEVAALLDPRTSLNELIDRLRARATLNGHRPTFEDVHGTDPGHVRAADLEISRFLPERLLAQATGLPPAAEPRHFLLTGASGFLGQVVLAELLTRLDPAKATVSCLVRAADAAAARDRLARRVEVIGPRLRERFDEWTAGSRLHVVAGELTEPRLGLEDSVYAELAEGVDAVIHAGALVNHVLPYAHLFTPNVLGTAEIMRLAITRKRKSVHFISTCGIAARARSRGRVMEADRARQLWRRRPLRGRSAADYALGYATSKWAAEVMLSELNDSCGVPVAISRCSMLLPHREAPVLNPADAFARLLYGIVKTGVAPRSFYAGNYRGARHYDSVPVDLAARAIVEISVSAAPGFRTYHVCQPDSNDGVSLDTFVNWTESCGYKIERLDHGEWHAEFVRRLARLGSDERQRSPESIAFRWREPVRDGEGSPMLDATGFRSILARLGLQGVPSLDEAYFHRCLRMICGEQR